MRRVILQGNAALAKQLMKIKSRVIAARRPIFACIDRAIVRKDQVVITGSLGVDFPLQF